MDQDACVTVHDMNSEEYSLLAAVFEAAALRADARDSGAMDLDVADHAATLQSSVADMHDSYDPDRTLLSMAPPTKFYRRNWQSFSLRLLKRCTQTAKPYKILQMPLA